MKSTRQSHRKASRRGEVRARKVWAGQPDNAICFVVADGPQYLNHANPSQHFLLPADAESVERMQEQVARVLVYRSALDAGESEAFAKNCANNWRNTTGADDAAAVLASLNLTPTQP